MVMIYVLGVSALLVLAVLGAMVHILHMLERSLSDHTESLPDFMPVDQPSPSRRLQQRPVPPGEIPSALWLHPPVLLKRGQESALRAGTLQRPQRLRQGLHGLVQSG
ncbi:hypothetical protein [Natronohydrobacter thiooxidans]|uniref:hypothetical protein n=1 Tax=Natronohydrobacter thiooxidans TaxID=87172 RepID=UPI0008FF5E64|nr:hypothetical protein [Natronohydrobacter thiooxidans]